MPLTYVTITDLANAYEGDLGSAPSNRVKYLLEVAVARLNKLVPGLDTRMTTDPDLVVLARDVVVQAVLRQLRNPSPEFVQQTQSAGPYSVSTNMGSGNTRGNRGLFYQEELDLLIPVITGQRTGTILQGLSYWGAQGAR